MTERLSSEQRAFFRLVAEASFSNPFSRERDELDYRISRLSSRVPNAELMAAVRARVAAELKAVGKSPTRFEEKDRKLLRMAHLFESFHRREAQFDQLIEAQYAAGDGEVPVPFADELLAELEACGLEAAEADLYVAFFFQLRRAYFFVGRALAGQSPAMVDLRRHLWNNVFTYQLGWYERWLARKMEGFSTLLLGETGTGKGTVAAAIGRSNFIPFDRTKRRFRESFTRAFVAINLSQYPDTLMESELFGHKKGAFTGAVDNHAGVFARCSPHGAIFIDEVGDVSIQVQVKLLSVLQERAFTPVGSHETQRFSGRVIAATNKDVAMLRRSGLFRDDFYYRLCSDVITVPPLRQRLAENPDELDHLLPHVLRSLVGEDADGLAELGTEVRAYIERHVPSDYAWPGNVRELEQCVRRILITGRYDGDQMPKDLAAHPRLMRTAREVLAEHCRLLYQELGTYEEVARVAGLDRRTVKKHILGEAGDDADAGA